MRTPARALDGDDGATLPGSDAQTVALREELAESNAVKEAQRIEMVEQRQRSERQVQGAQAEIQRLASEVDAEKARTKGAVDEKKELKAKLTAVEEELKRSRGAGNSADAKSQQAALQAEVLDLQKKFKAASDDKDAAKAKAEALERLVEGVRARSRELAEELKTLREASGGKVS